MKVIIKLMSWIDCSLNKKYLYGRRVGSPEKLLKYFYCPKIADNAITKAKLNG